MSATPDHSSHDGGVAASLFVVACGILSVTAESGVGGFISWLLIGAIPALILFLFWKSLEGRAGARVALLIAIAAAFLFVFSSQEGAAKRKARQNEEVARATEAYEAWYNSLTPYQKTQEDNKRLREENARLREQANR